MELAILGGSLEYTEGVCASPGPRAQAPKEQTARVELLQANSSTPNSNIHFAFSKLCLHYCDTAP